MVQLTARLQTQHLLGIVEVIEEAYTALARFIRCFATKGVKGKEEQWSA
jgi:hypothetical protein